MRHSLLFLLLLVFSGALFLTAFQSSGKMDSREILIQGEVDKRVNTFITRRRKRCRDRVMERASELVDSILIVRARAMTIDTFQKPPIPIRPLRPEVPVIEDTTAIEPLLPPLNESDTIGSADTMSLPRN